MRNLLSTFNATSLCFVRTFINSSTNCSSFKANIFSNSELLSNSSKFCKFVRTHVASREFLRNKVILFALNSVIW